MGNRAHDILAKGQDAIFAYEEAIGYMLGSVVLDKDGISSAAAMAEFACWLHSQGRNFSSQLEELYQRWAEFVNEPS